MEIKNAPLSFIYLLALENCNFIMIDKPIEEIYIQLETNPYKGENDLFELDMKYIRYWQRQKISKDELIVAAGGHILYDLQVSQSSIDYLKTSPKLTKTHYNLIHGTNTNALS